MTAPERLLSGPRGRRLCAELLRRAPGGDVVHRSLFHASLAVEERRGDAGTIIHTFSVEVGDEHVVALPPLLPLPEAIGTVDPGTAVHDAALLPALADTVASAMGWQPPHGEDVALAGPAVVEALLPVAQAVVAHPGSAWWSTPADPAVQCRTVFEDRERAPSPGPTTARLADWRARALSYEASAAAYRAEHGVPVGGPWWVTPSLAGLLTTTRLLGDDGSPALWMTEDDFGWDEADVVPCAVDPGARVREIHGPGDWADLVAAHPLDVTGSRAPDWFGAVDARPGAWLMPDWASVAREHDAVHVTVLGWLTTSGVAVPVPVTGAGRAATSATSASTTLAGWDPDATWWLADVGHRSGSARRWVRTDAPDGGRWHPAGS